MSHFTVMVIGENPEDLLQPFHEYECTRIEDEYVKFVPAEEDIEKEFKEQDGEDYETIEDFARDYYGYEQNEEGVWGRMTNPNAKWDWYQLGGRWAGSIIRLKEGAEGITGEPSWGNPNAEGIDAARKGDIDLDAIKDEAEVKARARYKEVMDCFGGTLPVLDFTWEELTADETLDWDEKRTKYRNQPAMVEVNSHTDVLGHFFELKDFQCTLEEFVERKRNDAFATFAVIKDGKWYERGKMGWWACVSDEKDGGDWNKEQQDLLADVDDDELISIYDCHI